MIRYSVAVLLTLLFATAIYLLLTPSIVTPPIEPKSAKYRLANFSEFPAWEMDNHSAALEAFQISCERILRYPDNRNFNDFGTAALWKPTCRASLEIDPIASKKFFENNFSLIKFPEEENGLFTGYYAPLYKGSREKDDVFDAPLYMVPNDLQSLNLGDFDQSLRGRTIIGEVRNNRFVPYKDRKQIEQGALADQGLELVWLQKTEETFFLQIQGSGFIELPDGEVMHLGYAERNGRPYRAIGRYLIESGDIAREDMSLQAILDWMIANPDKSDELMWKNPSYVFFQERNTDKPIGSQGVGLTPERSLAVDRAFIPMGAPLWLETYKETTSPEGEIIHEPNLSRLMIAQDTGGAIKGQIRGDVYWGIGPEAELRAGPMKDVGMYHILVPNAALPDVLSIVSETTDG